MFEGRILKPGSNFGAEENAILVALECAGPQGKGQYREMLWILWRYDWPRETWVELGRAQSRDASWTKALREPALAALHPRPELFDIGTRANSLAEKIVSEIDEALEADPEAVKLCALNLVYDRVAGRIAGLVA
jgi:hypothetical protein